MAPQVTIWRTARTIEEARRYAGAMRALGLTVTLHPTGYWKDETGEVRFFACLEVTSWRKGVVRARYPNPKMREVLTPTVRSRINVKGTGPVSSPHEMGV